MNIDELLLWKNSMIDKYRDKIAEDQEISPEEVRYVVVNKVGTVNGHNIYQFSDSDEISIFGEEIIAIINFFDSEILSIEEYQKQEEELYKSLPIC